MGLVLCGVSVVLVARAAVMPRLRASETLGRIGSYGFTSRQIEEAGPGPARTALDGVAASVGGLAGRLAGFREASVRRSLVAAGIYGLAPRKFVGYRILCALAVPTVWLWLSSTAGYPALLAVTGAFLGLLIGWTAPMSIVRRRTRARVETIDYELPNLID